MTIQLKLYLPKSKILALIASALALLLPSLAAADKSGRVVQRAEYGGKYEAFDVKMERRLVDLGGGKFLLEAKAKNFFASISETESFYWRDEQIIPIEYHYKQKIFGIKKTRSTMFDWEAGTALFRDGDETKKVSLSPRVLGPMTYQLRLQLDLIKAADKLEYQFIKRGRIKDYRFVRMENETLDRKNIGQALLVRRKEDGGDKQTDVWFDVDRGYALAAIKHTDDGDTNSMYMEKDEKFPPLENTPYQMLSPSKN